ncbi:MAG: hypothetical protein ACLQBY_16060 [Solirubrobacteraceae bacterium]
MSAERAGIASADPAACPLKPSSAAPPGEAWAFTDTSPPSTPHPGITSSYTHGRGAWAHGRGTGTICAADSAAGQPSHNLVLTVAGASHVYPRITRLGHLGGCSAYDATYTSSQVHVLIADDGRQVN